MYLPRELVYEEKPSIYAFGVNDDISLNQRIFEKWLLLRPELDPEAPDFYPQLTKIFNDAYFVCTIVLMRPGGDVRLSYFNEHVNIPSIVYPLAHLYLSLLPEQPRSVKRLFIMLENLYKKHMDGAQNHMDLLAIVDNKKESIDSSEFSPLKLTKELLSHIDWRTVTNGFKEREIKRIVCYIATDGEDCKMVAEAIENAIEESKLPKVYVDEEGGATIDTPHPDLYISAQDLCQTIIETKGESILYIKQNYTTFVDSSSSRNENESDNRKYAPKRRLAEFLKGDWFDEFSTNSAKYTEAWRTKMVDELIESKYGVDIVNDWHEKGKESANKRNMIKCGLAGCLIMVGVLKCQKNKLAPKLGIGKVKNDTIADYLGRKKLQPYCEWLKTYVETNHEEPFSD